MLADIKLIKELVLETVSESYRHVTPGEIEKKLLQKAGPKRKEIKKAIKDLVEEGELTYSYNYGCSFIEKSFNKPVRISKHVVLKPPGTLYQRKFDDVVVEIQQGVSFGTGQHPTTRLAIRGIEYAALEGGFFKEKNETCALDIGTGSGVLAIVSVLLGINKALGIDIDSCARSEARENVIINGLENRIKIDNQPVENIEKRFSLIIANLRYPTIKRLYPHLTQVTAKEGYIVISGIKEFEEKELLDIYTQKHFTNKWKETEKDWVGMVFKKNS